MAIDVPRQTTSSDSNVVEKPDGGQTITLPRRIVYFQAALLGIIATTFFVFGMMVGTLTSRNQGSPKIVDCTVTGTVVIRENGEIQPDAGAVVILLPTGKNPEKRRNPRIVHPDSFQPVDNEIIDEIHQLGGAVVRTDAQGKFNVLVDSPARYEVIVISKNGQNDDELTKKEMATLSTYFMPVEQLRKGKSIHVSSVRLETTRERIGEIKF